MPGSLRTVHTGRFGPRLLGRRRPHRGVRQRVVAAVAGLAGAGRRMPMRAVAAVAVVGVASRSLGRGRRSDHREADGLGARCVTSSTG